MYIIVIILPLFKWLNSRLYKFIKYGYNNRFVIFKYVQHMCFLLC